MSNEVQIIGGGLYGCLTAYHIAKNHPDVKVHLVEGNDHLISAFDSITLDNQQFNNGFHGLEVPRSQEFYQFIKDELDVSFELRKNFRGLSIKGHLIDYLATYEEWPEELKHLFKKQGPIEFDSASFNPSELISEEFTSHFRTVSARYSDDFDLVKGLFFPWFLPADFYVRSEDEGDIFRNAVRSGELKAEYAHPEKDLFGVLQQAMEDLLRSLNVNIHLNTYVKFGGSKLKFFDAKTKEEKELLSKVEHVYFCGSLALILKDLNQEKFGLLGNYRRSLYNVILESSKELNLKYSEVLAADTDVPNLGRISFPSTNKRLIQMELFVKNDEEIPSIVEALPRQIERILRLDENSLELKDFDRTRVVFFPPRELQNSAVKEIGEYLKDNFPKLSHRSVFGPINMSKAWRWSKENGELLIS